jgi:sulfate adenylyltransferase subunit 1
MDVLRITTAGSVDDGKSTLIGRLLYDTGSLTRDKLEAVELASRRKGLSFTDLSLLTDGLIAEREQGITIDVAYIYFSTPRRKYIIADTPGHAEYTRNMITGASTASVFMILVDARNGITEQTRRHFFIASLLRIRNVVVCVNKMDLVGFNEDLFVSLRENFRALAAASGYEGQSITFIPMAARHGDNIATRSGSMRWYSGATLLEWLEAIAPAGNESGRSCFQVQSVIRPHTAEHHDFRGYTGRLSRGQLRVGDSIVALPSRKSGRIKSILVSAQSVQVVHAGESAVLELATDIDVSRGSLLVEEGDVPEGTRLLKASICWMDEKPLRPGGTLLLQQGVSRIRARVESVDALLDVHTLRLGAPASAVALNDIAHVTLKLAQPLFAEPYAGDKSSGSFILIDESTNNTVAAGFVEASRPG